MLLLHIVIRFSSLTVYSMPIFLGRCARYQGIAASRRFLTCRDVCVLACYSTLLFLFLVINLFEICLPLTALMAWQRLGTMRRPLAKGGFQIPSLSLLFFLASLLVFMKLHILSRRSLHLYPSSAYFRLSNYASLEVEIVFDSGVLRSWPSINTSGQI